MKKNAIKLPEIKLAGIMVRTNNANEMTIDKAKIPATIQKYFHEGLIQKLTQRKNTHQTYCVYTEYDSDVNGDYTYFIGEAVDSFSNLPVGLSSLIIPSQNYIKFTNGPGKMPDVCISAWQKIWSMNSTELGGTRQFLADFEIYDERATDVENTELDIYIGVTA